MSILSGEGLLSAKLAKSQAKVLPSGGEKFVEANGSWLERTQIESILDEQHEWIAEEKTEKRSQLSEAVWNDDLRLAEVTKRTGSCWQSFGFQEGADIYLRPEEALFLVEATCLELQYGGAPVSVQQGYELLFKNSEELQNYRVYRELMQVGYRARRSKDLMLKEGPSMSSGVGKSDGMSEKSAIVPEKTGDLEDEQREKNSDLGSSDVTAKNGDVSSSSVEVRVVDKNTKENNEVLSAVSSNAGINSSSESTVAEEKDEVSVTQTEEIRENVDVSSSKNLPEDDCCMIIEDDVIEPSFGKIREIPKSPVGSKRNTEPGSVESAAKKSRLSGGFAAVEAFGVTDSDDECMIVDEIDSLSPTRLVKKISMSVVRLPRKPVNTVPGRSVIESSENGKTGGQQTRVVESDESHVVSRERSQGAEQNRNVDLDLSGVQCESVDDLDSVSVEKESQEAVGSAVSQSRTSVDEIGKEANLQDNVCGKNDRQSETVDLDVAGVPTASSSQTNQNQDRSEADEILLAEKETESAPATDRPVTDANKTESLEVTSAGDTKNDENTRTDGEEAVPDAAEVAGTSKVDQETVAPSVDTSEKNPEADDSDDDIIFLSDDECHSADSDEETFDLDEDLQDAPDSPEPQTSAIGGDDDDECEVVDLEDDTPKPSSRFRPKLVPVGEKSKPKPIPVFTSSQISWKLGNKSGTGLSSAMAACAQSSVFIPFGQSTKEFGSDDVVVVPVEKEEPELVLLSDDETETTATPSTTAESRGESSRAKDWRKRHYRKHEPDLDGSESIDETSPKKVKGEESPQKGGRTQEGASEHERGFYIPPNNKYNWNWSWLWNTKCREEMAEEREELRRMNRKLKAMRESREKTELLEEFEKRMYPFSKKMYDIFVESKKRKGEESKERLLTRTHGMYVPEDKKYRWDESILWNNIPARFKEEAQELRKKKKKLKALPTSNQKTKLIDEYEALLYPFSKKIYEDYVNRKKKGKGSVQEDSTHDSDSGDSEVAEAIEEIIDLTAGDDERDRLLAMIPSIAGTSKIIIPVPSMQFLPRNVDPAFPFYTWENGKCAPSILVDRLAESAPAPKEPKQSPPTTKAVVPYIPPPVTPLQSTIPRLPGGYTVYSPSFSHRRFGVNPWTDNRWGAFQLHVFGRATPFGFQNFGPNRLPNTSQYQRLRSHFDRLNHHGGRPRHQHRRRQDRFTQDENRPSAVNQDRKDVHGTSASASQPAEAPTQPDEAPRVVKKEPTELVEASRSALPLIKGTASTVSWKEYKKKVESATVKQEPVTVKQEPLVRPEDAGSVGTVLNRLAVIKNVGKPTMSGSSKSILKPTFDLFSPDVRYRKSGTDPPNFRLAISRDVNVPAGEDFQPFLSSCKETVRAVVAVPFSSVLYFEVAQVEIPTLNDDIS